MLKIADRFAVVGLLIPILFEAVVGFLHGTHVSLSPHAQGIFEDILLFLWPSSVMALVDPKTRANSIFIFIISSIFNALSYGAVGMVVGWFWRKAKHRKS